MEMAHCYSLCNTQVPCRSWRATIAKNMWSELVIFLLMWPIAVNRVALAKLVQRESALVIFICHYQDQYFYINALNTTSSQRFGQTVWRVLSQTCMHAWRADPYSIHRYAMVAKYGSICLLCYYTMPFTSGLTSKPQVWFVCEENVYPDGCRTVVEYGDHINITCTKCFCNENLCNKDKQADAAAQRFLEPQGGGAVPLKVLWYSPVAMFLLVLGLHFN